MRRSRLRRRTEKKNLKTILISVVGIVIILYLLFKFGIILLVNFSLLLSGGENQNTTVVNQIDFIPPPVLNPIPSATNSSKIVITGKSVKEFTINIYLNNKNIGQTDSDEEGNFSLSDNLEEGLNQIKAVAEKDGKKSDFSNILRVTYKNSLPELTITFPSDGQSFSKDQNNINVTGTTDPGNFVTVNGFWAIIDKNNNYSYNLTLQNGDNQIKVVATDQAGNQTQKQIKVSYSQ